MTAKSDTEQSREFEMRTYLNSMKAMYDNALAQNGDVYDIAFRLTKGFSAIESSAILEDLTRKPIRMSVFEQAFKNIDDVLCKDAGCTSELG